MKRYEPSNPRAAFGVAAFAVTALAFGLLVAVPASVDTGGNEAPISMASRDSAAYGTEVMISPARINVIADRHDRLVQEPTRWAPPKQKQAG